MADGDGIPMEYPKVRMADLNESSTHYDYILAAPSDGELFIMWIGSSAIGGMVALYTGAIFLSICLSAVTRKNPFNNYLIYLSIPDIVSSVLCSITCALNASVGHYWAPWMCRFQSFYAVWYVTANAWINAVILFQLHRLLSSSRIRRRYTAPTRRRVFLQASCIYLYAAFVASMGLDWKVSGWPHKSDLMKGLACMPLEFSFASTMFYYIVFIPLLAGIPMIYVFWACYDIWKRSLMPPVGRRRLLSIYFIRIVFVFVVMFLPFFLIVFFAKGNRPWLVFAGGAWSHLQGAVSASMTLLKPDIREAFLEFLSCRIRWREGEVNDEDPTSIFSHAAGLEWSGWRSLRSLFGGAQSSPSAIGDSARNVKSSIAIMANAGLTPDSSQRRSHGDTTDGAQGRFPSQSKDVNIPDDKNDPNAPDATDVDYASPLRESAASTKNDEDTDVLTEHDLTERGLPDPTGLFDKDDPSAFLPESTV